MINRSLTKLALALAAGVFVSVAQAKPTLKEVTDATEAAAAKAPDQAASIVEEKVKETPEYACPIIKAAAKGAKLQKEDETDLVAAALKAAPEKAPEIRACLGNGKVAGGKNPVGKEPVGKGPVTGPTTGSTDGTDYDNWNQYPGVVGTYLSSPANGSGTPTGEPEVIVVTETEEVIVKKVVSRPVSRS
jgi:hypothetical protein